MALLKSEAGKSQISTCDTQKINKRLILQFIFQGFMHFSAVLDDSTGWSRCVGFFYFGSTWNTEERISCFFKSDLKRSSKKKNKKPVINKAAEWKEPAEAGEPSGSLQAQTGDQMCCLLLKTVRVNAKLSFSHMTVTHTTHFQQKKMSNSNR